MTTPTEDITGTVLTAIEAKYQAGARVYGWEVASATGLSRQDVHKVFLRLIQPKFGRLERRNGWFHRPAV